MTQTTAWELGRQTAWTLRALDLRGDPLRLALNEVVVGYRLSDEEELAFRRAAGATVAVFGGAPEPAPLLRLL